MRTYPKSMNDNPYHIQFMFLDVICRFLESCDQDAFEAIYGRLEEIENTIAALFSAKEYAQSTIFANLSKVLFTIYRKISRQEWMQIFPTNERISRERIIEAIEDIKRR